MFPNKRTAWCGLAVALALSACGSGADDAATDVLTSEPVAVEAETDQASADDAAEQGADTEAAPAAVATTDPPLTLPVPSADGDASAQPDNATGGDTTSTSASDTTAAPGSESTTTQAPTTAAPTTAAPTTQAPTTAAPTTQPPAVNRFPDVSVVNVADRQAVSMAARLGGGDRPVLLWFWTPF